MTAAAAQAGAVVASVAELLAVQVSPGVWVTREVRVSSNRRKVLGQVDGEQKQQWPWQYQI
jgi:hypothetical protein